MKAFHDIWAWVAIVSAGGLGIWGLVLVRLKKTPGRSFRVGIAVASSALIVQVVAGAWLYSKGFRAGGWQHVFYGVLIPIALSFGYVYRSQMSRRPALAWGLLFLFAMGLAIRSLTTV